ncbi:MAG TPA: EAL domain-containing protein [Pararobbsia sp.]|nr:EAL domain-containing protein [Pararobbsia sp.]
MSFHPSASRPTSHASRPWRAEPDAARQVQPADHVASPAANGPRHQRDALAARVLRGLLDDEFALAFQGIYDAKGALRSVEALVRWIHPDHGLLAPSAFLVTMEHPLVARELTDFVIARACEYLGERQRAGRAVCSVAVNVPPSVAAAPSFAAHLRRVFDQSGADPSLIEIELSESEDATLFLASPAKTRALRNTGIKLALDDFGTGYSSLSTLSIMDFDTVKIARELLVAVPESPRACAVMAGVLNMLEQMAVRIVVEGVETRAQARWLAQWPNVFVQGYLWGKPRLGKLTCLDTLTPDSRLAMSA